MLFDKTATVYTLSRNAKMVTSWVAGAIFLCNIQPYGSKDGVGGIPAYNQYKLYTELLTIKEGDKIVQGSDTYIVRDVEDWKGVLINYLKVTIEKPRGN